MSQPVVSIITTVHDLEPYVERCIRSVLDQTYRHWEQIIVDDGSIDGTADRIREFRDPRIRYIRLPHRGIGALAESYNAALAASRGELVAILEGDDFWPTEKLRLQVPEFSDPAVQLTWGRAVVVDRGNRKIRNWPSPYLRRREMGLDELFRRLTCANILTPTVTVMLRRSALETIGGFKQPAGALFVDLPTWLEVAARVKGNARMLDANLGYYRVHDAQMSTQYDYEYHTVQANIVSGVIRSLSPAILAELGWDKRQQRRSRASADLRAGVAQLRRGKRAEARALLLSAVCASESPRALLRAALGLFSTVMPWDLVAAADRVRRAFLAAAMRLDLSERANR